MALRNEQIQYVHTVADIFFTGDTVCCARCPCEETYSRKSCRLTGELLVDDRHIGYWCPLRDANGQYINKYMNEKETHHEEDSGL